MARDTTHVYRKFLPSLNFGLEWEYMMVRQPLILSKIRTDHSDEIDYH